MFDKDRSGGISLPEFQMMWRQHGLASYVKVAETEAAAAADQASLSPNPASLSPTTATTGPPVSSPAGRDPVEEIFIRFNRNNDNILDMEEVREMLEVICACHPWLCSCYPKPCFSATLLIRVWPVSEF